MYNYDFHNMCFPLFEFGGFSALTILCNCERFCYPKLKAVRLLQGHAEKLFKIVRAHFRTVRRPEKIVDHALPFGKTNGERGGKLFLLNAFAIRLNREGVDFKLVFQKGGRGTAKA